MGLSLKGIGRGLKKIGKTVGGVASKVAPFAGFIPGVGPLAAGALGAGGALLSGKNLKDIAKAGLVSGGGAYLGGKALGAIGKGGGSLNVGGFKVPDMSGTLQGIADKLPGSSSGGGILDTIKRGAGSVLKGALNHPELALAGVSALSNARDQAGADKLYDQGLGDIRGAYNAKAPLRAMALKQLQDPRMVDMSGVFRPRGNPFAEPVLPPVRPITRTRLPRVA